MRDGWSIRAMRDRRARPTIDPVESMQTEVERRVLDLLAVDLPTFDIALLLRISEAAVQRHMAALLRRYGADDRASLLTAVRQAGQRPGLARLSHGVSQTGPLPPL